MNVINKFLDTYNYKFKAGVFNPKDKDDLLLLENILDKLLKESSLSKKGLTSGYGNRNKFKDKDKYPTRGDRFKKKIEDKETFKLVSGEEIIIDKEASIKNGFNFDTYDGKLIGDDGKEYRLSAFEKTVELGGESKVSDDPLKPTVNTDIKEGLVVVMFNILKGGEKNLDVFNKDTFKDNITILLNSPNKYEGLDSGTSGAIEDLLNLVKGITIPPFKKDTTLLKIFNNPYSIAKVLNESYDSATADRGDLFDDIRNVAGTITGLPNDKWNPGDIYLVNKKIDFNKALKDAMSNANVQPINDLFVNEWGKTDKPLVSISLKEQKYQPGRAKTYLDKFGDKDKFNVSSDEELTEDQLKDEIERYRTSIKSSLSNQKNIKYEGDGWNGKFPKDKKNLESKHGAYKLFNFLLSDERASLLNLFSYGLSIDQDLFVNPTFWKLVGKENGSDASKYKYAAGTTTSMDPKKPITIIDRSSNNNIEVKGEILISDKGETRDEKVSKTFRTSGRGQVQIL